jgi:hypothetical protein
VRRLDNLLLVHVIFESPFFSTFIHFIKNSILFIFYKPTTGDMLRGARAKGAAGATAPIAQTVRGQHGGTVALFTGTALRNLCIIHRNWNL